jgi:hypothetical protein
MSDEASQAELPAGLRILQLVMGHPAQRGPAYRPSAIDPEVCSTVGYCPALEAVGRSVSNGPHR